MTNDTTRCRGSEEWHPAGGAVWLKSDCWHCLRRTAPKEDNKLYSYIQPPEFIGGKCPERIA